MTESTVPPWTRDWSVAVGQHRRAADETIAAGMAIPPDAWVRPLAPGKWSPAEVVEHLRLTYAALRRELATGDGMRVRIPWLMRQWLRMFILPRLLRTGVFPSGAMAVREIRPIGNDFDQGEALRNLDDETRAFELELSARRDAYVTHPFFGKADARTAMRFCCVHLLHHRRQLLPAIDQFTAKT